MKTSVVVDVGNTRIKWGLVTSCGIGAAAALASNDETCWQSQLAEWHLDGSQHWVVTGVHPERRIRLVAWLRQQGHQATVLDDWRNLPLAIQLDRPETAGIDRLLTAVAANHRRDVATPAVIVNAGTAVTVDWLDENGVFRGGAILPGLRLMTRALHEHTALLPSVELPRTPPALPAVSTPAAIQAGVFWAVAGGIQAITGQLARRGSLPPQLFLTGGDASLLERAWSEFDGRARQVPLVWPWMTLEGIRLAAERLP
jgi:type III pantothenate kinase